MTMRRRDILLSGAGLAGLAGLALAGCAADGRLPKLPVEIKIPENLSALIDDVNAITSKVSSIELPASAVSLIDKLKSNASAIAGSTALADAKSYVRDFSAVWTAIKPWLPKAGTVSTVVTAVDTVMPEILKVAGIVSMFAARRPTGMQLARARAILHS